MKSLWPGKALIPRFVMILITLFFLGWTLAPFYFMIIVPLQVPGNPAIGFELPKAISLEYFKLVLFGRDTLWRYLINSCIVSGASTIIVVGIAIPCAYTISRWRTKLSKGAFLTFFILRMFPPIALVIPYYLIFARLHLIDTKLALVIIYIPLGLPLGVWLLKGFFDMIPVSMEEAAEMDGATMGQVVTKIMLPLIRPGIAVSGAFVFLICYIEYIYALTFTIRKSTTFPLYITGFIGEHWLRVEEMVATTLIGLIPLVLLYACLQKYIRKGVSFGVLK